MGEKVDCGRRQPGSFAEFGQASQGNAAAMPAELTCFCVGKWWEVSDRGNFEVECTFTQTV